MSMPTPDEQIVLLQDELMRVREGGEDSRGLECKALGDLGIAYYQGQRWQEALGTLTEYLNLAIELGEKWSEAVALYYLGFTQQAIKEPWLAVKSFALAYRWFRGLGLEEFAAIACRQKYWRRLMKIFKGGL